MVELKSSSEDLEERFRRLFIREMTRDEKCRCFLADALLPSEEHLEKTQG